MVDLGILVAPEKAGRGARCRLAPEVVQEKQWLEARIPALRRFLAEHESLKNADYRSLFDVPRHRAVSELRRLVEEGYLVLEGEKRGARYTRGRGSARRSGNEVMKRDMCFISPRGRVRSAASSCCSAA